MSSGQNLPVHWIMIERLSPTRVSTSVSTATSVPARPAGWTGPVKSPTFALVETYPVLNSTFNHFDFYRFEDPMEFEDAGFRDLFGPGQICATEWTQKAEPFVPDADLKISLFIEGLGRRAEITALTPAGERILAAVAEGACEHA